MPTDARTQVTQLLDAAVGGDTLATERLFPLVYEELRRMAVALMGREKGGGRPLTLQPTALVNEAYLRLVGGGGGGGAGGKEVPWNNRAHFFGAAALAMRRILIDRARHVRATRPRQAGALHDGLTLPTLETDGPQDQAAEDLIALDKALTVLKGRDERQHEVVMLRFFAGLTIEQTSQALDLSPSTVKNEWAYARAWLMREVERGRSG
ncbi:MAG: ECF-type sigma factor [Phycisphaerales bacterium]